MPYDVIMPKASLTMTEGTLLEWFKQDGAEVKKGERIAQIETDKVVIDIEAPGDGQLAQLAKSGAVLPVAAVMGYVLVPGESRADIPAESLPASEPAQVSPSIEKAAVPQAVAAPEPSKRVSASPLARRVAQELGVDLAQVIPSDPGGKISVEDVRRVAEEGAQQSTPGSPAGEGAVSPVHNTVPLKGIRGLIAERMAQSAHSAAAVTLHTWVDATELVHARSKINENPASLGLEKVSYDSFLVSAVAQALRQHPRLNAQLKGEVIEELGVINVGVAVDNPRGLMTVVVKDADCKPWQQVAKELASLVQDALMGKASLDSLEGGTFTITNLGMMGISHFTPIITPPQCAILGVGALMEWPAVIQGQLSQKQMLPLSLTFDHRIVDGAPAARFLQDVRNWLENPHLLMMVR
ncbi:MAG: 2-oxo acid dehydrogenase subunit E2 [Chloroflexi bacterium]|nr:2-oxo acid dehydrogenase subunit E2 [Chloroflexota bacterium]